MSSPVRAGLGQRFNDPEDADLIVRFCLDASAGATQYGTLASAGVLEQPADGDGNPAKRRKVAPTACEGPALASAASPTSSQSRQQPLEGPSARAAAAPVMGEPVYMHKLVARLGSAYLQRKIQAWSSREYAGALAGPGGSGSGACSSSMPQVLVPLGSEAELPHATEALRFIYTGQLTPGLGFEALLRVRHQAGYLGVVGCAEAVDTALVAWVEGNCASPLTQVGAGTNVFGAYACHELFPRPGGTHESPSSFDRVLAALGTQLVAHIKQAVRSPLSEEAKVQLLQLPACAVEALVTAHKAGAILSSAAMQPLLQPLLLRRFRDAVEVLTNPSLGKLPACALEALLSSDTFTTDDESSVVLLVATWGYGNQDCTKQELRGVWRHVRLSRVSRPYLSFVLPCLDGGMALTKQQLGAIEYYRAGGCLKPDVLCKLHGILSAGSEPLPAWYSPTARPTGPDAGYLSVNWQLDKGELLEGLRTACSGGNDGADDGVVWVEMAHLQGSGLAPYDGVLWQGLQWHLAIRLDGGLLSPAAAPVEAPAGGAGAAVTAAAAAEVEGGSAAEKADHGAASQSNDMEVEEEEDAPHAGISLSCNLPQSLGRYGIQGAATADPYIVVDAWEGAQKVEGVEFTQRVCVELSSCSCWERVLPLLPRHRAAPVEHGGSGAAPSAAAGCTTVAAGDSDEALLAPWARYLGPGGKITGTITFRPL